MRLKTVRIQVGLAWLLIVIGAAMNIASTPYGSETGRVLWGIGIAIQLAVSVIHTINKDDGHTLGG